jgi:hypothetical protein
MASSDDAPGSEVPPLEPEPEVEPEPALAPKPTRITLRLCQEAIFPDYHIESLRDSDRLTQQLFETTKLRLNDMAITEIENLEMFTALQRLYLHHNQIRVIENMEFHPDLRVLSINNNQIEELAGLLCLTRLEYLNASSNKIAQVDEADLPPSLLHLNLSNNPAAWEEDYRQRLVGALPALQDLDAVDITPAELEAYGCVSFSLRAKGLLCVAPPYNIHRSKQLQYVPVAAGSRSPTRRTRLPPLRALLQHRKLSLCDSATAAEAEAEVEAQAASWSLWTRMGTVVAARVPMRSAVVRLTLRRRRVARWTLHRGTVAPRSIYPPRLTR